MNRGEAVSQASRIWSMLDDMAETNPAAYRAFIDKQLKEGREYMRPPEPHMCVRLAAAASIVGLPIFINFFSWPRVTKPQSNDSPIPVAGTALNVVDTEEGRCSISCVAFNPEVLAMYGKDASNVEERDALIRLAIDYVEDQSKMRLPRAYTIQSYTCHGPVEAAIRTLRGGDRGAKEEDDLDAVAKSFAPLAEATRGGSVREQLEKMGATTASAVSSGDKHADFEIRLPGSPADSILPRQQGGSLIEELPPRLATPTYQLEVKGATRDHPRRIVVTVELPTITSIKHCQLDVTKADIKLLAPEQYKLEVVLPETVDERSAAAKFIKTSRVLRITLPTLTAPE